MTPRLLLPLLTAGMLVLIAACASPGAPPTTLSATIFRPMNTQLTRDEARRNALSDAEVEARREIRSHVYERHLNDGRTLEDLAVLDPFVRAVIDDTIMTSQITDRTVSKEGVATVTVRMEWAPIEDMIRQYPQHALK